MRSVPGAYVVVMQSVRAVPVAVGRWGVLELQRGCYCYVGSALGPGGVAARVSRHCRRDKALRWHIDHLREHVTPLEAWCCYAPGTLEHAWATALGARPDFTGVPGFGCSDCTCATHLFFVPRPPAKPVAITGVRARIERVSLAEVVGVQAGPSA